MSQVPNNQGQLDSELNETKLNNLRHYRDILSQRYADSTSGKTSLPPEESLALRSNISLLSKIIEPGSQQMWPDYSPSEKTYLAQQAVNKQRNAQDIGIAFLGPLAAPAIIAKEMGAPTETVGQFLELGMNASVAAGVSRVGLRVVNARGVVEPIIPAKGIQPEEGMSGTPTARIIHSDMPELSERKFMQDLAAQVDYAQPALDWLRHGFETGRLNAPKLSVLLEHYSGHEGMRAAENASNQTIHEWLQRYTGRVRGEGLFGALEKSDEFVSDFVKAVTTEGKVDSEKLLEVLDAMKQGVYATPADYAAMQVVKNMAEQDYIARSVIDVLDMARSSGIEDPKILNVLEAQTRMNAAQNNPYQSPLDQEKQPPSPDQESER